MLPNEDVTDEAQEDTVEAENETQGATGEAQGDVQEAESEAQEAPVEDPAVMEALLRDAPVPDYWTKVDVLTFDQQTTIHTYENRNGQILTIAKLSSSRAVPPSMALTS